MVIVCGKYQNLGNLNIPHFFGLLFISQKLREITNFHSQYGQYHHFLIYFFVHKVVKTIHTSSFRPCLTTNSKLS